MSVKVSGYMGWTMQCSTPRCHESAVTRGAKPLCLKCVWRLEAEGKPVPKIIGVQKV